MPTGKYFFIKSVQAGSRNLGYWDQGGRPKRYKRGTDLKSWAKDRTFNNDQRFRFISAGGDYYYIRSANGGYVDISGGKNRNGVKVQVWSPNKRKSQKFRFKHLGNGKWKIYTSWGRAICLAGRSHKNGSNIHTWTDHNGAWMEWYLEDVSSRRKYMPEKKPEYPAYAEFMKHNKDKAFNYRSANLATSSKGTAYIVEYRPHFALMYISYEGRNPMNGKMEKSSYVQRIFYDRKTGEYYYSPRGDMSPVGKADKNDKRLNLRNSQGAVTFEVTGKHKSSVYPEEPEFFINNRDKTFIFKTQSAFGTNNNLPGEAKVKKIEGKTVILTITRKYKDTKTGEVSEKTSDTTLYLKDGVYTYDNEGYYTWGIAGSRSKKLTINGEQHADEFILP